MFTYHKRIVMNLYQEKEFGSAINLRTPVLLLPVYFEPVISELLTNAMRLLSGDQDGVLMVPWPP